jgi:myo-inositol-1(or 4)-monophosphatase
MLEGIKKLTLEAGGMLLQAGKTDYRTFSKEGRGEYLTHWDIAIQKSLNEGLLSICPEAGFLGEEGGVVPPELESGWCFIVDPIDGTSNFIRGLRHSCVSAALAYKKEIRYGVICDPYQGELFYAERGKGAFCNGVPIHTAKRPLGESIVIFGTSSYNRAYAEPTFRLLRVLFDRAEDLRSGGSAALDLCHVAAGRGDVFFEYQLCPWDYAAASLIITEAGGTIETIGGAVPDLAAKESSIIAAGSALYGEIRKSGLLRSQEFVALHA